MSNQYTVDSLYNDMMSLYKAVNDVPFSEVILPIQLKEFGDLLEDVFKQKFISYREVTPLKLWSSNKVGVSFSGGKDSAALAFHLRNKGYSVTLYHVANMNRAYPDERKYCDAFARKYGFPLFVIPSPVTVKKGAYIENVVKNNLLIAQCLQRGMLLSVPNVGLGCAFLTREMLSDFGFSDSNQNLGSFSRGVELLFGNRVFVEEIESEGLSYKTLLNSGVDFSDIVSCMMPIRYRGRLRKNNLEKGLTIRPDGCGQCYKCAMDYYYLESAGVLKYDSRTYAHYADVLVKQWDRSFVVKPKNLREYFPHFLSSKYIDMERVFRLLQESGVDIDAEI